MNGYKAMKYELYLNPLLNVVNGGKAMRDKVNINYNSLYNLMY